MSDIEERPDFTAARAAVSLLRNPGPLHEGGYPVGFDPERWVLALEAAEPKRVPVVLKGALENLSDASLKEMQKRIAAETPCHAWIEPLLRLAEVLANLHTLATREALPCLVDLPAREAIELTVAESIGRLRRGAA